MIVKKFRNRSNYAIYQAVLDPVLSVGIGIKANQVIDQVIIWSKQISYARGVKN